MNCTIRTKDSFGPTHLVGVVFFVGLLTSLSWGQSSSSTQGRQILTFFHRHVLFYFSKLKETMYVKIWT